MYTIIHTLVSLVAIFTGLVVLFGLLADKRLDGWTKWVPYCRGRDYCNRFLLSVSWFHASNRSRPDIVACLSPCDLRALSEGPRRSLALDLCNWRCDFALF
jgi:hypothetical protein